MFNIKFIYFFNLYYLLTDFVKIISYLSFGYQFLVVFASILFIDELNTRNKKHTKTDWIFCYYKGIYWININMLRFCQIFGPNKLSNSSYLYLYILLLSNKAKSSHTHTLSHLDNSWILPRQKSKNLFISL